MELFNIKDYEVPDIGEVDMAKTKKNVGTFLVAYKSARQRVGCPREPKITATFGDSPAFSNSFHSQVEDIVVGNSSALEEFKKLDHLYYLGISAIQHPFSPVTTDRRKGVFYKRFVQGEAMYMISQETNNSEEVVASESKKAIIQFANAIGILENRD